MIPKTMTAAPSPGSYDQMALLHEIGHAVGLEHGNAYSGGGTAPTAPNLSADVDNRAYTIMSYNPDPNALAGTEPRGLQQLDLAALQNMYGANFSTRSGNTTYTLTASTGIVTIWDGGGIDTLYTKDVSQAVQIDLRPGAFSSIGGVKNVSMALTDHLSVADQDKPLIENVKSGDGNDTLIGNSADNYLSGGKGHDSVFGLDGNDVLYSSGEHDVLDGGTGDDLLYSSSQNGNAQYVFAKGYGHDRIVDSSSTPSTTIDVYLRDLNPTDVSLLVERYLDHRDASGNPVYDYDDVYIKVASSGDTILLPWHMRDASDINNPSFNYAGDTVSFTSGSHWDMQNLESIVSFDDYTSYASLTAHNPFLYGNQHTDPTFPI